MGKNVFNVSKKPWVRPWNTTKFDDLYNRDDRFFSVVIKGLLGWLNTNIVLYDKSIKHFIFNTGSSYLYIEANDYSYKLSETTGENTIYMETPRCILELDDIHINSDELTNSFARGNYERKDENGNVRGYNAVIRRIPIELNVNLTYVLSTFNESLILTQEFFDKIILQRYFTIVYLGKEILCSIEFPDNAKIEFEKPDLTSTDVNQKIISISLVVCTNYPQINEDTEIESDKIINDFVLDTVVNKNNFNTDKQNINI